MDSVIGALVVIFVMIFAILTLSGTAIGSQDMLQVAIRDMEVRLGEQARTSLIPIEARTSNAGTIVHMMFMNTGSTRLTHFEDWDMIVQYVDTQIPNVYHVQWHPYTPSSPSIGEWAVEGIYADSEAIIAEAYDPEILNPGEVIKVAVYLANPIQSGTQVQALLAPPNGQSASTIFVRNYPPVLTTNVGITIADQSTGVIEESKLETTDVDNDPEELVYTVTAAPQQGSLNLGATFTQSDIAASNLSYDHNGSGSDSFQITINDGQDEIGPYTFVITISMPPTLATNAGLNISSGGSGVIGDLILEATDPDDAPADLIFTATTLPTQGSLSMTTFTQEDVDNALLSYTHVGAGNDSFQFTVSDGESTVGPFTFTITVS
jgi:hypothetical protein